MTFYFYTCACNYWTTRLQMLGLCDIGLDPANYFTSRSHLSLNKKVNGIHPECSEVWARGNTVGQEIVLLECLAAKFAYGQEPGARNETKVALDGKGRELYTNLVPCSQSFACVVLLQGEVILDQNPPDLLFYPELPCDGNVASVTPLAPMGFWKRAQIENENEPAV